MAAGAVALSRQQAIALQARSRVRPTDPAWPSEAAWQQLRTAVHGRLTPLHSPFAACMADPESPACQELLRNIKNPYYIQDHPALTQTLGWVDGWCSQPSAYVVTPESAADISAAVDFARVNNVRLVVKGGGHSYMGNSNAPDSLLIWTRNLQGITPHERFVPQGAPPDFSPQRAVTLGAGAIWQQAYDAVTTRAGAYVQGGGCTTVGVAGLIQGGGFGSYSKYFGLAAAGLLEAEVVTADGAILTVNAYQHPDLFWALKGGGGGTFAVVSQMTVRVHDLPEFCGRASLTVKASSDQAFALLLGRFVELYRKRLFNPHWGETVTFTPGNVLHITMHQIGLTEQEARQPWQPFLAWIARNSPLFTVQEPFHLVTLPTRRAWDPAWDRQTHQNAFSTDPRPGSSPNNIWWTGDTGQVSFVLWAYDSLWLPATLLQPDQQPKLVDTLLAASRQSAITLHFNKGLAGAPPAVLREARDTAMNPAVCDAFALVITGQFQGPAYPGIRGHEPDIAGARKGAATIQHTMKILRSAVPGGGSYISEASFFDPDYRLASWGPNYGRLARIKQRYDPDGLFFVHHGIGSEQWSADGFTRRD